MTTDPNTRFIQEVGFHGLAFGNTASAVEGDLTKDVHGYVNEPTAPEAADIDLREMFPHLNEREACLALVAGARHFAMKARVIEVAAAQYARQLSPPVTVRELAAAAGITERAATTRYPNPTAGLLTLLSAQKGGQAKLPPTTMNHLPERLT